MELFYLATRLLDALRGRGRNLLAVILSSPVHTVVTCEDEDLRGPVIVMEQQTNQQHTTDCVCTLHYMGGGGVTTYIFVIASKEILKEYYCCCPQ